MRLFPQRLETGIHVNVVVWVLSFDQLRIRIESQEVSPFPAGDHKAHMNRRAQRHSKHKTEQEHKRSTKEVPPWNGK